MSRPEPLDRFFGRVDRRIREARPAGGSVCSRGCAYCCYGTGLEISPGEQALLRPVLSGLSDAKRRGVRARAEAFVSDGNSVDFGRARAAMKPCTLLEGGRCLAYSARPLHCRLYGSTTVQPGLQFGCDVVQMRMRLDGSSQAPFDPLISEFRSRADAAPVRDLAEWVLEQLGGRTEEPRPTAR